MKTLEGEDNPSFDNKINGLYEWSEIADYHDVDYIKEPPPSPSDDHPNPALTSFRAEGGTSWRSPPSWAWCLGVLLLLFILGLSAVAVYFVLNPCSGFGSSSQVKDAGFGSSSEVKGREVSTTSPSLTSHGSGRFFLQFKIPHGVDFNIGIDDMCWTATGDLMLARLHAQQLWRISIDHENNNVTNKELLYEGLGFSSVSCSVDGAWAAVVTDNHIKLYQPGSGKVETWKPSEVYRPWFVQIDDEGIMVGENAEGAVLFFGRDKSFKKKITVDFKNSVQAFAVSDERLHVTTGKEGRFLHIFSLKSATMISVGGKGEEPEKFESPIGVATDSGGNILVCDFGHKRVSMFSSTGVFLRHVELDLGELEDVWPITVMKRHGKPDLLASGALGVVRLYELV